MTYYIQSGDNFTLAPSKESLLEELPAGFYTVEFDSHRGQAYFARSAPFEGTDRVYGDYEERAARIVNTFKDRKTNTGVLLAGEQGSGKSLLARMISLRGLAEGMPVVLLQKDFTGAQLLPLLGRVDQPAIFFVDEFEKLYKTNRDQETLLSLMDGTTESEFLFLFTVNEPEALTRYMNNRPGRIYYRIDFTGLEDSFVQEYGEANLKNGSQLGELMQVSHLFSSFNFDMLKAVVEECNRYGESPSKVIKWLNVSVGGATKNFRIKASKAGEKEAIELYDNFWYGNPILIEDYNLYDGSGEELLASINGEDLVSYDRSDNFYLFEKDEYRIEFREIRSKTDLDKLIKFL